MGSKMYETAFPWRVRQETGSPDWARTPSALAGLAHSGRADVQLAWGDPGPVGPRAHLGPAYRRAYARARFAAGFTPVLLLPRRKAGGERGGA